MKLISLATLVTILSFDELCGQTALDNFDPNANGAVYVVVVQPDGKILIGGEFTTLSPNGGAPVTRNRIARLNPDGTLDPTFNPNADNVVWTIAVQADGKILVGGSFTTLAPNGGASVTRNRIARLNPDGALDTAFNPNATIVGNLGFSPSVLSIVVQADGRILMGGRFNNVGGQTRNYIARVNSDGTLDPAFNPNASGNLITFPGVFSIAVQADGKILVGGNFLTIGGQPRSHFARLGAATGMADSFNPITPHPFPSADSAYVFAIAVQADGKILLAGQFTSNAVQTIGGQMRNRIARLDATTGLADSFNPNANGNVHAIAVQADGKILAGGSFTTMGIQTRNRIARLDAITGSPDSFNPNTNNEVRTVALQADGKILAGGLFSTLAPDGGAAGTRNRIARLHSAPVLIGLEVTQGVQDMANSVRLVENKRTFVRAYVKNTSTTEISASASLTVKDNTGAALGIISNSNDGTTMRILPSPQRASLVDSFYFELLPEWTRSGTYELSVAGDEVPFVCGEAIPGNECSKVTVTFLPVAPLSMKFMLLTWVDDFGIPHTSIPADAAQVVEEFLGGYPINTLDVAFGTARIDATITHPCTNDTVPEIVGEVDAFRNWDCSNSMSPCKEFYQGLLKDFPSCASTVPPPAVGGKGPPGHTSVAFIHPGPPNAGIYGFVRLHEQGHIMGLIHTNSGQGLEPCGPFGVLCTKLEGDGALSFSKEQYEPDTVFGLDVNGFGRDIHGFLSPMRIYEADTFDFMSYYPSKQWISRVNYNLLLDKFVVAGPSTLRADVNAAGKNDRVSSDQTVLIGGTVQFDGSTGQIRSVFVNSTPVSVALPPPGEYAILLQDSQGAELARFGFDPLRDADGLSTGIISLLLPYHSSAKRIVLLHNEDVLDFRQASANSPTLKVIFPNGGENLTGPSTIFTWTGSDPDGDALSYTLDYSTDNGTTWETLAVNLHAESLPIALTSLRGSNQALFRVTASDGFNSAQARSQGTFSVTSHSPDAHISSPEDNRIYVGDQTITLRGMGLDIEEGLLEGSRLTWASNLNGLLGTGRSLAINALMLQEGTHTITLTAADNTMQVGSASVSLRVFRQRPALPATLAAAPAELTVRLQQGHHALQTVAIRNRGDGDLPWSASADQPWINLGSTSGSTPYNLQFEVLTSGLAVGQYSGLVTIQAPGAVDSPQVVAVDLLVQADPVTTVVAYSRKMHGNAGPFDIELPLTGSPGIECRGGETSNDYQVVFKFTNAVTFNSASVTGGTASLSSSSGGGTTTVTVNLTGVSNAQTITVTLFGVNGGMTQGDVSVQMSVLVGDANGDATVGTGDAQQTRNRSGQTIDATNFRSDINTDGAINSADATIVRARSGTGLGSRSVDRRGIESGTRAGILRHQKEAF